MGTTPGNAERQPAHEREAQRYPGWLRWLLAQWWGLLVLIGLGLLTNIVLFPLSQGFGGWWSGVRTQVAALLALPSTQPVLGGIGTALVLGVTVAGHLANRALKREEQRKTEQRTREIAVSSCCQEMLQKPGLIIGKIADRVY